MTWEEWHVNLANKIKCQILKLIDTSRECGSVAPPTMPASDIGGISEQNVLYLEPRSAHLVWTVDTNKRA